MIELLMKLILVIEFFLRFCSIEVLKVVGSFLVVSVYVCLGLVIDNFMLVVWVVVIVLVMVVSDVVLSSGLL